MNNAHEQVVIAGIPIGYSDERRGPILQAFAQRGAEPSATTLANMRSGVTSGYHIERIAAAVQILLQDDASKKNTMYSQIAKAGTAERVPLERHPQSFNSKGFIDRVSFEVGMTEIRTRRALRVMRAEVVFISDAATPTDRQAIFGLFLPAAEKYFDHPKTPQPKRIKETWAGKSIKGSYALLAAGPYAFRGVGVFTSYEVELFQAFYSQLQAEGNRLTDFDEYILLSRVHRKTDFEVAQHLREKTGIRIDKLDIPVHLNALLGTFTHSSIIGLKIYLNPD